MNIPVYWYRVVQKQEVEEVTNETREKAHEMVAFASRDLKLAPPPEIIWICSKPISTELKDELIGNWWRESRLGVPGSRIPVVRKANRDLSAVCGFTPDGKNDYEIWLPKEALYSPKLEILAAHEVRHVFQKSTDRKLFEDESRAEGDASFYSVDITKQFFDTKGTLAIYESQINQVSRHLGL